MRIWLPATMPMLAELAETGAVRARTPARTVDEELRRWYLGSDAPGPDPAGGSGDPARGSEDPAGGDDEELEWVATVLAARDSRGLQHELPLRSQRRAVIVAEVPTTPPPSLTESPPESQAGNPGEIRLVEPVERREVVALLLDEPGALAQASSMSGAGASGERRGDAVPGKEGVQEEDWGDDVALLWFAPDELADLLGPGPASDQHSDGASGRRDGSPPGD